MTIRIIREKKIPSPVFFSVLFFILTSLTLGPVHANSINSFSDYSPELQKKLGRAFINHLHNQYDVIQDPEINQYIRNLGHKIAQHTDRTKFFRFYVINNSEINAFAGPDGVIGIHSGLIQSVTSEDELASVIAHEIAHVTQDHLYRRLILQSKSTLPQIASMIAAILIGTQDTNAGMAVLLSSNALQIQKHLKYSRLHEYEADHAGINYLYQSGYNPHAMPDFFEKLANAYQHYGSSAPEILRTHPLTENRLAKAQERALSLGDNKNKHSNTALQTIQIRLNKFTASTATDKLITLTEDLLCYQQSLENQVNKSDTAKTTSCLTKLINKQPQQFLYHAQLLEHLADTQRNATESELVENNKLALELFPSNESILIRFANLLVANNKIQTAINHLEQGKHKLRYKYSTYRLLSKLYEKLDQTPHSYFNLALAQQEIGNLNRAKIYIQKAKASTNDQNSAFNSKLDQLEEQLSKLLKDYAKE